MIVNEDNRPGQPDPSVHEFRCCDTTFLVRGQGVRVDWATRRARRKARSLESQLNAFDDQSDVSQLNRTGTVTNKHVSAVVRRGLEYRRRTEGRFDIFQGNVENNLKAYLDGRTDTLTEKFFNGTATVNGSTVQAEVRLDLNGLAKGYIVDRAAEALRGSKRKGFVSGGGDMSPPTGPVAIDHPDRPENALEIIDTGWSVATSGGYRRNRQGKDHIYDPMTRRIGSRQQSVTVVARRDCTEADALATTLAAMPVEEGLELADEWSGLEALIYNHGKKYKTREFDRHVRES